MKNYVKFLNYIPLILPDLIIGVALLIFFNMQIGMYKGVELGMTTIFIAHTAFNIPFSLFIIMARLDEFDYSIVEAARDLGANEFQTLLKVILPSMMPGIVFCFSYGNDFVTGRLRNYKFCYRNKFQYIAGSDIFND